MPVKLNIKRTKNNMWRKNLNQDTLIEICCCFPIWTYDDYNELLKDLYLEKLAAMEKSGVAL